MSRENVERLRAAYEVFNQTGEIVLEHLAPDFELHQASSIIDTAGVFHGPNALRDVLRELDEAFEDFKTEVKEMIEAPNGEVSTLATTDRYLRDIAPEHVISTMRRRDWEL